MKSLSNLHNDIEATAIWAATTAARGGSPTPIKARALRRRL